MTDPGTLETEPDARHPHPESQSFESTVGQFVDSVLNEEYHLLEAIGAGGMGTVFRARQLSVGRDVAVKLLHRNLVGSQSIVQRFENEARLISQLRHPNTLRLFDCRRTSDGEVFIVTELLSGRPLSHLIADEERIDVERAVQLIDQMCRSLDEAHSAGIVHRDLKPGNVFLDRVGSEDVVKVLDFGIAKILDEKRHGQSGVTSSGVICGTPWYMSPEQAQGTPIDQRADIYALGCMFYEMLTGAPPFPGKNVMEVIHQHLKATPASISARCPSVQIPRGLEALVMQMLEKEPAKRPQTVSEVRERAIASLASPSFEALRSTELIRKRPAPEPELDATLIRPVSTMKRPAPNVVGWTLAIVVAFLGALFVGFLVFHGDDEPVPLKIVEAPPTQEPPAQPKEVVTPEPSESPPPAPAEPRHHAVKPQPTPKKAPAPEDDKKSALIPIELDE